MSTEIGNFNERITVEAESRTPDANGGYTLAWVTVATLWAMVTPLSSAEKWQHGQLASNTAYKFTIRFRADITAANRLNWAGALLNIQTITQRDGGKKYLDIIASTSMAT